MKLGILMVNLLRSALMILVFLMLLLSAPPEAGARFDGRRAFEFIKEQCEAGPRSPGGPGREACLELMERELSALGIHTHRQKFTVPLSLIKRVAEGTNLIALYEGDRPTSDLIALSTHWDTRPIADLDPDPALRGFPIPGGNDGGSGVALLLELARVVKARQYPGRILFIFFDLEDSGIPGRDTDWCLGSRHFAAHSLCDYPVSWGINVDMIADRDLKIRPELFSLEKAPDLTREFWTFAEQRAPFHFSRNPLDFGIFDDHKPFLDLGIPWINLIDFSYPPWHTHEDTPDKCSPISLEIVGNTILEFLFHHSENPVKFYLNNENQRR